MLLTLLHPKGASAFVGTLPFVSRQTPAGQSFTAARPSGQVHTQRSPSGQAVSTEVKHGS